MRNNDDIGPTIPQIRMLIHLGAYNERSKYLTRQRASDLIAQVLKQKELEYQKRCEERAAIDERYAPAWQRLHELENKQREEEWAEMQKRLLKM